MKLELTDIRKTYETGPSTVEVLRGISFNMNSGENMAITGPSGSGKSTLMHIIGTLDNPSSGRYRVDGREPFRLDETKLARFRNRTIGFVFQEHYLLPQYSILENVMIPTLAFKDGREGKDQRARELIERVGLSNRMSHRPAELSGGERQRVAIARALINAPSIMLCDEPTGNLDQATTSEVMKLLFRLHTEEKTILIAVTHNPTVAGMFSRAVVLQNGVCVE